MRNQKSIVYAAAVFALLLLAVAGNYAPTAEAQTNCQVESRFTPDPAPWRKSGGTTFTISQRSSTEDTGWTEWSEGSSCTTGPNNGDTCWATGMGVTGERAEEPGLPARCFFSNTAAIRSPANRVDATLPACGAWGSFDVSGNITLSVSTDGQSGIKIPGGSCQAGPNESCSVIIEDNVGNTRTCQSPVRQGLRPMDGIPPRCGTLDQWTGDGSQNNPFRPSGASDVGSGLSMPLGTCVALDGNSCTVPVEDNEGNYTNCISPVRPMPTTGGGNYTFACAADPDRIRAGSSTAFKVLDTSVNPQNSGSYAWTISPADPEAGSGAVFTTKPVGPTNFGSVMRTATIRDDRGNSASCSVTVSRPLLQQCHAATGIFVSSGEYATTWTITGPETFSQNTPSFNGHYYAPFGTYTITPGQIQGMRAVISPAWTQTYVDGGPTSCGSISFDIDYVPVSSGNSVTVTSNLDTTWQIDGPAQRRQETPSRNGSYSGMPPGVYSISIPNIDGYILNLTPSYVQHLSDAGAIAWNANYTTNGCRADNNTLIVTPSINKVRVNEIGAYQAWFDPDGPCSNPPQDVTAIASWRSLNTGIATSLGGGRFRGNIIGQGAVEATYRLKDTSQLEVIPDSAPNFNCAISPNVITYTAADGITKGGTISCNTENGFSGAVIFSVASTTSYARPIFQPIYSFVNIPPDGASTPFTFYGDPGSPISSFDVEIVAVGSGNIYHRYPLHINVIDSSLGAGLTANPASGDEPLVTTLTATVGGSETGPINYTFWKNCAYNGTNVAEAMGQCGNPAAKFDGVSAEIQTTQQTYYLPPGSQRALVIVERGSGAASATATVSPRQVPTHAECVPGIGCVQVGGAGVNRCSSASDCGGGGGDFRGVCDAVQRACVNRAGPGPSTCATDPACSGGAPTHLECQSNACVIVGGGGINEGGCTAVGQSCTTTPTDGACTFRAVPSIIQRGNATRLEWVCNGTITSCNVLAPGGATVGSGGGSGNVTINNLQTTTQYTLSCNRGTFNLPATVYVVQSLKEVPPGGR